MLDDETAERLRRIEAALAYLVALVKQLEPLLVKMPARWRR